MSANTVNYKKRFYVFFIFNEIFTEGWSPATLLTCFKSQLEIRETD